jgi:hypothetical protein
MRACLHAGLRVVSTLEQGAHLDEGGAGLHHGDEGGLFLEPVAEPLEEDVDELKILNGITKFAELVGHSLDTLAVDAEGG